MAAYAARARHYRTLMRAREPDIERARSGGEIAPLPAFSE
ncbi:hypothetical protein J2728_001907 [Caulobacter segnis]|nr:hypothetical protein [Caulobacter segnis]